MPPALQHYIDPVLDPTAQGAIVAVISLMVIDMVVGIVGAIATKTFSSEKMRAGLLHKFTELACIAVAIVLDGMLLSGLDLGTEPVLIGTSIYISVMEVGSVLELIKKYNPDLTGVTGILFGWATQYVQPKGGGPDAS